MCPSLGRSEYRASTQELWVHRWTAIHQHSETIFSTVCIAQHLLTSHYFLPFLQALVPFEVTRSLLPHTLATHHSNCWYTRGLLYHGHLTLSSDLLCSWTTSHTCCTATSLLPHWLRPFHSAFVTCLTSLASSLKLLPHSECTSTCLSPLCTHRTHAHTQLGITSRGWEWWYSDHTPVSMNSYC